ncbi:MAG: riboflavin biosynthesis protein RibF [Candidatus Margulisbacteria bacterium]|nr:riboflavin biosynthesis protein RibF [Candidatus Margulisiibacteriota bacterium]
MTISLSGIINPPIDILGIGVFDGMHLGHQQIADKCTHLLTFNPHPDLVLQKNNTLKRLTTLDELRLLYPNLICLAFTSEIAKLSPEDFLNKVILENLSPSTIMVGYDFRFGYQSKGTLELLEKWALSHRIRIKKIKPITKNNIPIKSSAIRQLIEQKEFNKIIPLLGHDYLIKGHVIKGDNRGKSLGFPTANLSVPSEKCLPPTGVYKGYVMTGQHTHDAIVYIGTKSTFGPHDICVEVHILNQTIQLYGQDICLYVSQHIREDMTFSCKEDLILQIKQDIQQCYPK